MTPPRLCPFSASTLFFEIVISSTAETNAQGLEYFISLSSNRPLVGTLFLQHLRGEQANIDDADNVTVRIDNREGKEFVENEELARVENSRRCRDRDDPRHHQLAQHHLR